MLRSKNTKDRAKNEIVDAREKVLVLYFEDHKLSMELWTIESLWSYIKNVVESGLDPLDIMHIPQNEYALGRAEVFGLRKDKR